MTGNRLPWPGILSHMNAENSARQTGRVLILFFVFAALLTFTYQLFMAYRKGKDPVALRQNMGEAVQSACFRSGAGQAPDRVTRFCQCYTDELMRGYNDKELAAAAGRGANLNAEDRSRAAAAAQVCRTRIAAPTMP